MDINGKEITFEEVVVKFLKCTIPVILSEEEIPRFSMVFLNDAFIFFEQLKKREKIRQEEIENLKELSKGNSIYPVVYIYDYDLFFKRLTAIVNHYAKLNYFYFEQDMDASVFVDYVITRIWLRMGVGDVQKIEEFLKKQLQFLQLNGLDDYVVPSKFMHYYDYDVVIESNLNSTFFEATRCMNVCIVDQEGQKHHLSNIHYDILTEDGQQICYIYAVQKGNREVRNSKLERFVYKINEGILKMECMEYLAYYRGFSEYYPENIVDVSPNQVLALLIFIGVLRKQRITQIRVPILQILSYDYHVLLGKMVKEEFFRKWDLDSLERMNYLSNYLKKLKEQEYARDKEWYDRVVDREDFISENKIEKLIRLFYRVSYHYPDMKIINEPLLEGDYLDVRIPISKRKKKERIFIDDFISI